MPLRNMAELQYVIVIVIIMNGTISLPEVSASVVIL